MSVRLASVLCLALACVAHAAETTPPKLAVVISIDQFRGDYFTRFGPYFSEGGFKRLLAGGTNFENNKHRHSLTLTAPGHASILTGTFASSHGITSNEWLDRETWDMINSVEDRDSALVGITPAELGPVAVANPAKTGRSPRNLLVETVGDRLKAKYGDKSKVFAASNKDRSAILLGGKKADVAYWDENGKIVTSRYYRESLPAWVEAFNAEKRVHATFGKTWDRLLEPALYDKVQGGPDDEPAENDPAGLGRTFPRTITGGKDTITPAFFTAFDNAPFAAEFLGEFVQRGIKEEKLGHHAATDLLCVSFSQVDAVGHNYGPDSHEMMDAVLRIDRVIASLLDCLDREVGLANCVLVLSADHGVAPLPERVMARDPATAAGRVKTADMDAAAKKALDGKFGALAKGENWFTRDNAGYHLRPEALAAKKVSASDAANVVKAAFAPLPYVAEVYTRDELLATEMTGESTRVLMRRSYRGASDRDVVFALKPYFMTKTGTGSSHGAPYDYDRHVPQLYFGKGVPKGVTRKEAVGVDDIATTFAALIGIDAPKTAQGKKLL
ncbi:MAG: alkaline phosphatase family protein [Verrucomicrobiota bacterium]